MPSTNGYFEYIKEQLSSVEGVSYRKMMGEYIVYVNGKVVGGVYDDRLLVKQTNAARSIFPDSPLELPYEGAKHMVLVDNTDDKELLSKLFQAVYEELPEKKKR